MAHGRRRGTAIVETPQGILVVREKRKFFILPGGAARRHESRREAAIRELREETGLEAKTCTYLFSQKGRVHKDYRGGHYFDLHEVFLITADDIAKPHREIKEVTYFNNSNVPISYTTKKIIERYLALKKSKPEGLRCDNCGGMEFDLLRTQLNVRIAGNCII
jgi:8-oxo-dGTP pyrophosphatase MutT (NUDIX family)